MPSPDASGPSGFEIAECLDQFDFEMEEATDDLRRKMRDAFSEFPER